MYEGFFMVSVPLSASVERVGALAVLAVLVVLDVLDVKSVLVASN